MATETWSWRQLVLHPEVVTPEITAALDQLEADRPIRFATALASSVGIITLYGWLAAGVKAQRITEEQKGCWHSALADACRATPAELEALIAENQ